ncbi:hypothetical protein UFOVP841_27 [uncultured Caudovirales phage]|uniref:Uncharacterized protein n=1 Tax=uncultured Caudovirales phage TaxID=2100421 RepID=A0A6J5P448_9CAUD|nr:hypothetical protein UFOVP841_27 [uncultured Caudovirales phage]
MSNPTPQVRDSMIHAARETRAVDDTKIMQKVNAVNREAFTQRFPNQLEHHMRLVSERLQACLGKPAGFVMDEPDSWPASSEEILNLSLALRSLNEVRRDWRLPIQTDA